jgi:polygalacturonase
MKYQAFRFLKLGASALGASLAVSGVAHATCADLQLGGSAAANTSSLQAAVDRCSKATDHLITLTGDNRASPAVINTVNLASNIVLKIGRDFILQGNTGIPVTSAVLVGKDVVNVTITGTGTIDGNGASYWQDAIGQNDTPRPKLIKIKGSNIWVGSNFSDAGGGAIQPLVKFPSDSNDISQTLKIRNSPKEQLVFEAGSQNVHVDGVWIYANPNRNSAGKNLAPNTDAIDIVGTKTATITNCLLDTGDDNIAIKSNLNGPATSGVKISACVIGAGHGISIGGQEAAGHTIANPGVSDVTVSNIHFKGTDFGYRIKTDQSTTNSGATTGVKYSNTCMQNVGSAFLFTYLYTSATGGTPPIIANVTIDNVRGTVSKSQGDIIGLSGQLMGVVKMDDTGIRMTNTNLSGGKPFNVQSGTLQLGGNSLKTNPPTVTANTNGQIVPLTDAGATVVCPGSIVIPPQV